MNIYRISQDENSGWDTFDSAVVYAKSEEEAKRIHPNGYFGVEEDLGGTWAPPKYVKVELLGKAESSIVEAGIIVASFNAG